MLIPLLTGVDVPIAELGTLPRSTWVYGLDAQGAFIPCRTTGSVPIHAAETILVKLDDETELTLSPDRLVLLRDGQWVFAGCLRPRESLMPLYRKLGTNKAYPGYELLNVGRGWQYTHRLIGKHLGLPRGRGWVIHHSDFNKRNNSPDNLESQTWEAHRAIHEQRNWEHTYNRSEKGRAKSRELMQRLWADPEWRSRMVTKVKPWEKSSLTNAPGWFATAEGRAWCQSREGDTKPCATCGTPVYRPPYLVSKPKRFCSPRCSGLDPEKREKCRQSQLKRWHNHKVKAVVRGPSAELHDLIDMAPDVAFSAGGIFLRRF